MCVFGFDIWGGSDFIYLFIMCHIIIGPINHFVGISYSAIVGIAYSAANSAIVVDMLPTYEQFLNMDNFSISCSFVPSI